MYMQFHFKKNNKQVNISNKCIKFDKSSKSIKPIKCEKSSKPNKIYEINNNRINHFILKMQKYSYVPVMDKKILLIFASHIDSEMKLNTTISNLQYFKFENIKPVLVNSTNLPYNSKIKEYCNTNNIIYYEIPNTIFSDFGKYVYPLNNIAYNEYDFIIFANDSYIIHSSIQHFINLLVETNNDLYAYTNSSEVRLHYQSYLFGLRSNCIPKFVDYFKSKKHLIHSYWDIVVNYELPLINLFGKRDCFLKIAGLPLNNGKNIFFHNDNLYSHLKKEKLLPFTKIKKITGNY